MRTLHIGLRMADLDRSLEFYETSGTNSSVLREPELGSLTMMTLPRAPFVTSRAIHVPAAGTITPGGLNHIAIQVEALHDTVGRLD